MCLCVLKACNKTFKVLNLGGLGGRGAGLRIYRHRRERHASQRLSQVVQADNLYEAVQQGFFVFRVCDFRTQASKRNKQSVETEGSGTMV